MTTAIKERYLWIDSIKIFACILVVLGHLYMSMVAGGWINGEAWYYCWPIQTIYTFHVPLFFVCSGFLYQNKKTDYSFAQHRETIRTKVIALGVPYVVFSVVTLFLKVIFSAEVNNQATPILKTLLGKPIAPYWYLYTLFFLFCFIPRFENTKRLKDIFVITVLVKSLFVLFPILSVFPDIITKTATNAIWFVLGMLLTEKEIMNKLKKTKKVFVIFPCTILISVVCYKETNNTSVIQFILAILFVYSLLVIFLNMKYNGQEHIIVKWSQYFMPVYLMHTIFAAGIRVVLVKAGISSLALHLVFGSAASFVCPILVYEFVKKFWFLLLWIEPFNAIRAKEKKRV